MRRTSEVRRTLSPERQLILDAPKSLLDSIHMNNLKMESPGKYQISIQGFLNADWSDRLGGLKIVTTPATDGRPVTTLKSEVVDQAVLLGVLNALYDLRCP